MKTHKITSGMIAALLVIAVSASAQVPLQFTYQGRLTDADGIPVTAAVTGEFRIVKGGTATNGGQVVFTETHTNILPDGNGVFSIAVGSVSNIPLTALADGTTSNRYLEAVVNNETNLPRIQLLSVPFAFAAQAVVGIPTVSTNAPVGGIAMSPKLDFAQTDTTTITEMPGLQVTISTRGRPVVIALQGDGGGDFWAKGSSVVTGGRIYLRRDEHELTRQRIMGTTDFYMPVNVLRHLDTPPAGTHTYRILWNVLDHPGPPVLRASNLRLVAYEL